MPFSGFRADQEVVVITSEARCRVMAIEAGYTPSGQAGARNEAARHGEFIGFMGSFTEEVCEGIRHGLERSGHPDYVEMLGATSPGGLDLRAYAGGVALGWFLRTFSHLLSERAQ